MNEYNIYGKNTGDNKYRMSGDPISETNEDLDDLIPGRLLVWHDEFDEPVIDENKWSNVYGDYRGYNWNSKDIMRNISSGNGMSFWTAKDYPKEYTDFSGAYISTNNLFEFRYGRLEAKMRFPSATPHHTTFWTLGACGEVINTGEDTRYDDLTAVKFPSCGEIDIAEYDNGNVGNRIHYSDEFDSTNYLSSGNINELTDTPSEWHIYAIEWTKDSIKTYVDGVLKNTVDVSGLTYSNGINPFRIPHYIVFDCISSLNGTITWDIAKTDVAWVRVYAPEGVDSYITETAIMIDPTLALSVGERAFLSQTFIPENPSDMTLKWESYNPTVAVCYGGMVTGISAGVAMIKVTTRHNCVAFCKVTVTDN